MGKSFKVLFWCFCLIFIQQNWAITKKISKAIKQPSVQKTRVLANEEDSNLVFNELYFTQYPIQIAEAENYNQSLAALPVGSQTTSNESQRIRELYNAGEHNKAIMEAVNYLNNNPEDYELRFTLGQFYFQQKYYNLARQQFTFILSKKPDFIDARLALIEIESTTGNYGRADDLIKQGLAMSPNDAQLLSAQQSLNRVDKNPIENESAQPEYKLLRQMWESGKHQEAITRALKYLKVNPKNGDVRLVLGQFYFEQKKYDLAHAQLSQALKDTPTYVDVRIVLINTEIATRNYERATQLVNEGLLLTPDNDALLDAKKSTDYARNQAQIPMGAAAAAGETIEVIDIDYPVAKARVPSQAGSIYKLLRQLWESGKHQEAITRALEYLKNYPHDGDVRLALGQFYLEQKKYDLAREQLNQALKDTPTYTDVRVALINTEIATKNYERADVLVNEGLSLTPNNDALLKAKKSTDYARTQAKTLVSEGKETSEIIETNEAKYPVAQARIPTQAGLQYKLLRQLWESGKHQEAVTKALEYLKSYPHDGDVRLVLGQFYLEQKKYDLAREQLNQALKDTPTYTDVRVALINTEIATKNYGRATEIVNDGLSLSPDNDVLLRAKRSINYAKTQSQMSNGVGEKTGNDEKNSMIEAQRGAQTVPEYKLLRQLWEAGKHQEAIKRALEYLKSYQHDGDVRLALGQFYLEQKKYDLARAQLSHALKDTPTYVDVRVALINTEIATKNYNKAIELVNSGLKLAHNNPHLLNAEKAIHNAQKSSEEKSKVVVYENKILWNIWHAGNHLQAISRALNYLKSHPDDGDVRLVLGMFYYQKKYYLLAYEQLQRALDQTPTYTDVRIALINNLLAMGKYEQAQMLLNQGYYLQPSNVDLISTQAKIYLERGRFRQAADTVKLAILKDPKNEIARSVIDNLNSMSPRYLIGPNTIGIYSENYQVSDLHQLWDFTTVYYGRDTYLGYVSGKVNYNSRLNTEAAQVEIEAYPVINKNLYFYVDVAFANQPILFPNYLIGGEGYVTLPNNYTASLGGKYNKITSEKNYYYYTGSVSKQIESLVLTFRPYQYVTSSGLTTRLYTGEYRYYIRGDADNYFNFIAGIGKTPDLNDLLAADFITVNHRMFNSGFAFPLFNHTCVAQLRVSYDRQFFPSSGLIRKLVGGTVGILKRF